MGCKKKWTGISEHESEPGLSIEVIHGKDRRVFKQGNAVQRQSNVEEFILEARDLSRKFKGFFAVKKVNLKIRKGAIHALIGPNGAGKTTCFNLLTKSIEPSAGEIFFNNADITKEGPAQVAQRGLVRSFQISSIFPNISVLKNIRVALQQKQGLIYNFWHSSSRLDALNDRCYELLDYVGLVDNASHLAGELPYGKKRALEIATTLAMDPALMLLDEPTQGMGYEDVAKITELIERVAKDRTILMVEHNMGVVGQIADWITVLQFGEVIAEGKYSDVANDPKVLTAYMGDEGGDLKSSRSLNDV